MRRGWRLLRKHGLRSRSGQVSAVATVLALLLFVSFLSTFVLGQLGTQMSAQEFQHQVQVEDQLERLQDSILQSGAAWSPGPAGLTPLPSWNQGNLCTPVAGVCTNSVSSQCTPALTYNQSINGTALLKQALTYDLTGSNDCIIVNLWGSNDTVTMEVTGSNAGTLLFTLYGTNDTVILGPGVSGSGFHASFYIYGAENTYEGVAGPTGGSLFLNTYFIGETPKSAACPYGNLVATDTYSFTGASSSNSIQNLTWYNAIGYATAYHATSGWPGVGNTGTGVTTGWQNVSAVIPCAFAQTPTLGLPTALYLSNPVTLNSGGVPPFGPPSSGSLSAEPGSVGTKTSFAVANVTAASIPWNTGSACFGGSPSGTCTTGTGLEFYNFRGNSTTVTPTIAGCAVGGCNAVYNVSGNSNTITFSISGSSISRILIQISGNLDHLTIQDSGTCNIRQSVSVIFSGNNDTYALTMSGCATGVGGNLNTTFVGSSGSACPYGNAAKYDTFSTPNWGSSDDIYQNLTWRNAYGIVTVPHTVAQAGGDDDLTFGNTSGYYQCLFTNSKTTGPYALDSLSGIRAVLNNRYIQPSSVAYEGGAVILGVEDGGSVMINHPTTSYTITPAGILFSLTLVSLTGVSGTATGFGTAAVISTVLSVQSITLTDGKPASTFLPYFYLNITTPYPQAWATYWNAQNAVVPTNTLCVPGAGVTVANCLTPPIGHTSTIVVPINAEQFAITSIIAEVHIY
jgi:hypothetical protein